MADFYDDLGGVDLDQGGLAEGDVCKEQLSGISNQENGQTLREQWWGSMTFFSDC